MLGGVSRPATCCSYLAPCWASWWATCLLRSGCASPPPAAGYTPLSGSQISGDVSGILFAVFWIRIPPDPKLFGLVGFEFRTVFALTAFPLTWISSLISRTLLKKSFKILDVPRVCSRIQLQIQNDKESKPFQIQNIVLQTTDKNIFIC